MIYAFARHFNGLFLVYAAIVGLAFYALLVSLIALPLESQRPAFATTVIARTVIGFLLVVALLFAFQWLSKDVPALVSGTIPPSVQDNGLLTNPVRVMDQAVLLPGMITIAILLWRRQRVGALLAPPLLVFAHLTVPGILAIFVVMSAHGRPTSVAVELLFAAPGLVSLILIVLAVRDMQV
jgi:hypothetical protein